MDSPCGCPDDVKIFITQRYSDTSPPPSAADLIAKLDQFLADMEQTARTAKVQVEAKKEQLSSLVVQLQQMEDACIQSRKDAAEAQREALNDAVQVLPARAVPPIDHDPVPDYILPEAREGWIYENMHQKSLTIWRQILGQAAALKTELNSAQTVIKDKFDSVSILGLGDPFISDYDGMTSGFDGRYRNVNVTSDIFSAWDLTPNRNACSQAKTTYEVVEQEATGHIDTALSKINPIHAKALGMDVYADYLGTRDGEGVVYPMDPLPSAVFAGKEIRNFDGVIAIIVTPDQELTRTIDDLETRKTIMSSAGSNMASGITQRTDWIKDQYKTYGSLMFNFENSLSYVVATLKQIDRLHEDPYFIRDSLYSIYDGVEIYTYKINTDPILAEIAAPAQTPLQWRTHGRLP